MDKNDVSYKIKRAMLDAGLTRQALGDKLGISGAAIGEWTRGKRNPTMGSLNRIAKATDKPLSFFTDETISGDVSNGGGNYGIIGGHKSKNTIQNHSVLEDYREKLLIRLDKMEANQKAMMAMLELLLEKIKRMEGKK